jgi:hypothetical protein
VRRSLLLFFTPFIIFTWIFFGISQKGCDSVMQADAAKPIPFNHESHIKDYGIQDCTSCHRYEGIKDGKKVDGEIVNGRFMGLPSVGDCTSCHARDAALNSDNPLEARRKPMLDSYKDEDRPWEAFAKQPDLVYFSHSVVMTAKYDDGRLKARCGSCHGDKLHSTNTKMIKGKMLMGQCMDCHTALDISNKCAVCHD